MFVLLLLCKHNIFKLYFLIKLFVFPGISNCIIFIALFSTCLTYFSPNTLTDLVKVFQHFLAACLIPFLKNKKLHIFKAYNIMIYIVIGVKLITYLHT